MPEIRDMVISFFVISGVLIGTGIFISGITSSYGSPPTNLQFISRAGNLSDNLSTFIGVTKNNITNTNVQAGSGQSSIFDIASFIVVSAFGIARTFTLIPDLLGTLISDIGVTLGVPGWVIVTVSIIIGAIVVFELVSIASKYKT